MSGVLGTRAGILLDLNLILQKIFNKISHVLRCPIHFLNDSAHDLPFTTDEKSVRTIPEPERISDCPIIVNEDGGRYS
jgi:hypothetical protein